MVTATDQRAVAAAFLSVVECLTDDGPLLVAIDDLQWLDPSSMHVVAFAARRLSGPVGILGCVRTEVATVEAHGCKCPDPTRSAEFDCVHWVSTIYMQRCRRGCGDRSRARRWVAFMRYPAETPSTQSNWLGRIDEHAPGVETSLPRTLGRSCAGPDQQPRSRRARCAARRVMHGFTDGRAGLKRDDQRRRPGGRTARNAESKGIIAIDGNRIHFAHPLLARGVYTEAAPGQRRIDASTARRDRRRARTAGAASGVGRDQG